MQVLVGTSGFAYKEWKGPFYPAKIRAEEMLGYYASRFGTVEINNTFYRMPEEALLAQWAGRVPPSFVFAFKLPRRITHIKRLHDAEGDLAEFVRRTAVLGARVGPLLVQLPPFAKLDQAALEQFLAVLPRDRRFAFEFRHDSWLCDAVYSALHAAGAMLCVAETEDRAVPLIATAGSGYLRLRSLAYQDRDLQAWAERIAAQAWDRVFVYFKHEDQALGPQFAARFLAAWQEVEGQRR
jgi:uncharacterized protein YecE (DUF72 family)